VGLVQALCMNEVQTAGMSAERTIRDGANKLKEHSGVRMQGPHRLFRITSVSYLLAETDHCHSCHCHEFCH